MTKSWQRISSSDGDLFIAREDVRMVKVEQAKLVDQPVVGDVPAVVTVWLDGVTLPNVFKCQNADAVNGLLSTLNPLLSWRPR